MTTAIRSKIISTVSGLSDSQLLEQTGKLASLDHQIQVFVIDHLVEIESRKLHLSRGFSGLFDYVARGLGYSPAAAWRRINAMKLCMHIEGARERLRDGSLTLDAAAQLQAAFERRDRERARAARSAGAEAGAAMRRNGSAPSAPALVAPPERKPVPELDVSARKALVDEAAGKSTRQVMQMLAEVDPELAVPADRVRALSGERWELKVVIDADCQRGLEQLKGLMSHVDPHMTLGQLVGRLVREGLDRHDPSRPRRARRTAGRPARAEQGSAPKQGTHADGAATTAANRSAMSGDVTTSTVKTHAAPDRGGTRAARGAATPAGTGGSAPKSLRDSGRRAPQPAKRPAQSGGTGGSAPKSQREAANGPARPADTADSAPKSRASGRAIPRAVQRQIWQRDGGRCRYVDPRTGRRCGSRHLLQIDPVFPYALPKGKPLKRGRRRAR